MNEQIPLLPAPGWVVVVLGAQQPPYPRPAAEPEPEDAARKLSAPQ